MKSIQRIISTALLIFSTSLIADDNGIQELESGIKQAQKQNKDIFLLFTGSDWCHFCKVLESEVLSVKEFKEFKDKNFTEVIMDQHSKVERPRALYIRQQMERFYAQGFPTVVLMDKDGRPYAKTGYIQGGAENYTAHLNELKKIRVKRDLLLTKAKSLTGIEKAKVLVQVLENLPEDVRVFYPDLHMMITKADPQDETKFMQNLKFKKAQQELFNKVRAQVQAGQKGEVEVLITSFIKKWQLTGNEKQAALLLKQHLFKEPKTIEDLEKIEAFFNEVAAIAPHTENGKKCLEVIAEINKTKANMKK